MPQFISPGNRPVAQATNQNATITPTTICYQMSTTNKSFIKMHYLLKSMGIQNNRFFLALLDPDLAGISPFDPNLNFMMKQKVLREVTNNFWYFVREVVRVPAPGVPGGVQFELHRANLAMYFCMMYNLDIFEEIPRQLGKTIAAVIRYLWIYNFGTSYSEISFLNKKLDDSKLNLSRLKAIRDLLHTYLRMDQSFAENGKKIKGKSTVEFIHNPNNSNEIKATASAKSEILAASLLRGRTLSLVWGDEWAFIPYNMTIFINAVPAIKTAKMNAARMGKQFGILLTTTAGMLTTQEGQAANEMRKDSTKFHERWYDLTYPQIMEIINSNLKSNFVHIRYSYQQLGKDEAWFASSCKDMLWKWNDIRREVLLEWSESSENCPFTKEELETIKNYCREPVDSKLIMGKYILNIYNNTIPLRPDYVPKYPPIIGVDVSGGYYHDASAVTIIDSLTTSVIADFQDNSISPIDLARFIYEVVCRYYPNAVINVERNGGYGASVIAKLLEPKLKPNLYFEIKARIIEEKKDGIRVIRKKQKTKVFGLDSSKYKRYLLIELLRERVQYHKDKFVSPVIYDEMQHMETKRNGKVEHSSTSHDDQVFSYLMALYVWYEGIDLRERYNIQKSSIKTDDQIDEPINTIVDNTAPIIDEIEFIQKDKDDETANMINILKQGSGILLKDFIERERKKEEDAFRLLMQNKAVVRSVAQSHGMTEDEVNQIYNTGKTIPDSVLNSFNTMDGETDMFESDEYSAARKLLNELEAQERSDMR